MRPIQFAPLRQKQIDELNELYRTTKDVRLRTRVQMILLAVEQGMSAPAIAKMVRESDQTVRNWFKRYTAEGAEGLKDAPRPGSPRKVTPGYTTRLVEVVRLRPRRLGLPYSIWTGATLSRLHGRAERPACGSRDRAGVPERGGGCLEPLPTQNQPSRPRVSGQKKTVEATHDGLKPGEVFRFSR